MRSVECRRHEVPAKFLRKETKGRKIKVRVRLGPGEPTQEGRNRIILEVVDTGIGLSPESVGLLFEEFYRAPKAKPADRGSSGLGLPFAARGARLMEAKVSLTPDDNGRAKAVLELPVVSPDEAAALRAAAGDGEAAESEPSRRVVIVGGVTASIVDGYDPDAEFRPDQLGRKLDEISQLPIRRGGTPPGEGTRRRRRH